MLSTTTQRAVREELAAATSSLRILHEFLPEARHDHSSVFPLSEREAEKEAHDHKKKWMERNFQSFIFRDVVPLAAGGVYVLSCIVTPFTTQVTAFINTTYIRIMGALLIIASVIFWRLHLQSPHTAVLARKKEWASIIIAFLCVSVTSINAPSSIANCIEKNTVVAATPTTLPTELTDNAKATERCYSVIPPLPVSTLLLLIPALRLRGPFYVTALLLTTFMYAMGLFVENPMPPSIWGAQIFSMLVLSLFGMMICFQRNETIRTQFHQKMALHEAIDGMMVEKARVDGLLKSMLSPDLVQRVLLGEQVKDVVPSATVFFSDVEAFTHWSSTRSAFEVSQLLHSICVLLDSAAQQLSVMKVKTIGDAYWAVCGIPNRKNDHASTIVRFALRAVEIVHTVATSRDGWEDVNIRVGVHSGPLGGAIVGRTSLSYEVFGETNVVCEEVEQNGCAGTVVLTDSTRRLLPAAVAKMTSDYRVIVPVISGAPLHLFKLDSSAMDMSGAVLAFDSEEHQHVHDVSTHTASSTPSTTTTTLTPTLSTTEKKKDDIVVFSLNTSRIEEPQKQQHIPPESEMTNVVAEEKPLSGGGLPGQENEAQSMSKTTTMAVLISGVEDDDNEKGMASSSREVRAATTRLRRKTSFSRQQQQHEHNPSPTTTHISHNSSSAASTSPALFLPPTGESFSSNPASDSSAAGATTHLTVAGDSLLHTSSQSQHSSTSTQQTTNNLAVSRMSAAKKQKLWSQFALMIEENFVTDEDGEVMGVCSEVRGASPSSLVPSASRDSDNDESETTASKSENGSSSSAFHLSVNEENLEQWHLQGFVSSQPMHDASGTRSLGGEASPTQQQSLLDRCYADYFDTKCYIFRVFKDHTMERAYEKFSAKQNGPLSIGGRLMTALAPVLVASLYVWDIGTQTPAATILLLSLMPIVSVVSIVGKLYIKYATVETCIWIATWPITILSSVPLYDTLAFPKNDPTYWVSIFGVCLALCVVTLRTTVKLLLYVLCVILPILFSMGNTATSSHFTYMITSAIGIALLTTIREAVTLTHFFEHHFQLKILDRIKVESATQELLLGHMAPPHAIPELLNWFDRRTDVNRAVGHEIENVCVAFFRLLDVSADATSSDFTPLDTSTQQQLSASGRSANGCNTSCVSSSSATQGISLNKSARLSVHKLIDFITSTQSAVDEVLLDEHEFVSKIKTVGDIYLLAGPFDDTTTPKQCGEALLRIAGRLRNGGTVENVSISGGMHFGSVGSAIIGQSRVAFDIFGDTVNTASRVMTKNAVNAGEVSVSRLFARVVFEGCDPNLASKFARNGVGADQSQYRRTFVSTSSVGSLQHYCNPHDGHDASNPLMPPHHHHGQCIEESFSPAVDALLAERDNDATATPPPPPVGSAHKLVDGVDVASLMASTEHDGHSTQPQLLAIDDASLDGSASTIFIPLSTPRNNAHPGAVRARGRRRSSVTSSTVRNLNQEASPPRRATRRRSSVFPSHQVGARPNLTSEAIAAHQHMKHAPQATDNEEDQHQPRIKCVLLPPKLVEMKGIIGGLLCHMVQFPVDE